METIHVCRVQQPSDVEKLLETYVAVSGLVAKDATKFGIGRRYQRNCFRPQRLSVLSQVHCGNRDSSRQRRPQATRLRELASP